MDLKYQIQLLEKRVVELESQNDALSQKLRAAQHEVEALAATVEALRVAWEAVKATDWNKPLEEAFATTPQQHLREVQAEAVIEFSKYIDATGELNFGDSNFVLGEAAQYAESIRAGEV